MLVAADIREELLTHLAVVTGNQCSISGYLLRCKLWEPLGISKMFVLFEYEWLWLFGICSIAFSCRQLLNELFVIVFDRSNLLSNCL